METDSHGINVQDNIEIMSTKITKEALTVLLYAVAVMSLFINLCSIIRNDYAQEQRKMRPKADTKLLQVIRRKETAPCVKYDNTAFEDMRH